MKQPENFISNDGGQMRHRHSDKNFRLIHYKPEKMGKI